MAQEHIESSQITIPEPGDNEMAAATQNLAKDELHESFENSKTDESTDSTSSEYLTEDALLKHIQRQANIVFRSLQHHSSIPLDVKELSCAFEKYIFKVNESPKCRENGTISSNPELNFYPTFIIPETLATYHLFFYNHKVPISCRANRTHRSGNDACSHGDFLPEPPEVTRVGKIFEGLGDAETIASDALKNEKSVLVELQGDNPRIAMLKRSINITHFAYPALNLPPKVMKCIMKCLISKTADEQETAEPVVSDSEIARWNCLSTSNTEEIDLKRKIMSSVVLVSLQLQCMKAFLTEAETMKKIGETLHYTFRHGYIAQACEISQVELPNLISYLGIMHENRLGQSVLHKTLNLSGRRDYIRDTVFLFLVYTWQTAMGVWAQCLEDENLKQLEKILNDNKKHLWSCYDEEHTARQLKNLVFPDKLKQTLQSGLPDFTSQSQLQIFRGFILERSGILPAMCNALPTDFIPMKFEECPPQLWPYTYLFKLANFIMYQCDLVYDLGNEGLLKHHCRCNLCCPLRSLALNNALLLETQTINNFEIQSPPNDDGTQPPPLKLTPASWVSAYLRKFDPKLYYPHEIRFYEYEKNPPKTDLTACVITQSNILAQLNNIRKAREQFLLKKGHGVYLDPQTGEELNTDSPSTAHADSHNVRDDQQRLQHRQRNGRGRARKSQKGLARSKSCSSCETETSESNIS